MGNGFPDNPIRHKDSDSPFEVREADELEAQEAAQKRVADTDRSIERLRPQGQRGNN